MYISLFKGKSNNIKLNTEIFQNPFIKVIFILKMIFYLKEKAIILS